MRDFALAAIGGSFGALVTLGVVAVLVRYGVPFLIKRLVR